MDDDEHPHRFVEEVFDDYQARRSAIIKALTTDVEEFFQQCDPEAENLCLYGCPNGEWEVKLPDEEVPPEHPEPALGINFSRDGMEAKDWLALVALNSDSWLLANAYFLGTRFGFDKVDRQRLFDMINDLPTVVEVVAEDSERSSVANVSSSNNVRIDVEIVVELQIQVRQNEANGDNEGTEDEADGTDDEYEGTDDEDERADERDLCGECGNNYMITKIWICCDLCWRWFHGECVDVTPDKAKLIKKYKCPDCVSKRAYI